MDAPQEMPRSGPVIALMPGEEAPLYPLDMPARLREGLKANMARAQLESLLQQDPETLEIRIGFPDPDSVTARAVVASAEACRARRAALGEEAGRVTALLPDYLAVRGEAGVWTLRGAVSADGSTRLIARLGPRDGFSAPQAHALAQLRVALETQGPPGRARLVGDVPDAVRAMLTEAEVSIDEVASVADLEGPGPDEMAFNILHDPAADRAEMQRVIRRWRLPLALMLAGCVALGVGLRIETADLRTRAEALNEQTIAIARRAFLPGGPILDLRRQVGRVISERQRRRADTADAAGPLALTHAATRALDREDLSVHRLQMTREGVLQVEVDVGDFARLEQLVAAIGRTGQSARILTSAVEDGRGVTAVIGVTDTRRDGGAQ
jgi:general secretion pathway protein L